MLLVDDEPVRKAFRAGDAMLLVVATICAVASAVIASTDDSSEVAIHEAFAELLGWADPLWRLFYVAALGFAAVAFLDTLIHGRWLLVRDQVFALALLVLVGLPLGWAITGSWPTPTSGATGGVERLSRVPTRARDHSPRRRWAGDVTTGTVRRDGLGRPVPAGLPDAWARPALEPARRDLPRCCVRGARPAAARFIRWSAQSPPRPQRADRARHSCEHLDACPPAAQGGDDLRRRGPRRTSPQRDRRGSGRPGHPTRRERLAPPVAEGLRSRPGPGPVAAGGARVPDDAARAARGGAGPQRGGPGTGDVGRRTARARRAGRTTLGGPARRGGDRRAAASSSGPR